MTGASIEEVVKQVVEELNKYTPEKVEEFLEKAVDIQYTLGKDFDLMDVVAVLSHGGPNIYLRVSDGVVEGYWGSDKYVARVENREFLDALWNYFENLIKEVVNKK